MVLDESKIPAIGAKVAPKKITKQKKGKGKNKPGSNTATTEPVAPGTFQQREAEVADWNRKNPPFIWPDNQLHATILGHANADKSWENNGRVTVKKGYIRRLTEFYSKVPGASTLQNLRCNFQFNPEVITRSIDANYDMQFFFNQSPDQLAQPIPGQAQFGFELLFNREAEMASGKYRDESGNLVSGKRLQSGLNGFPEAFIREPYDPAWVTQIGVLADIMILDDIVGQGLAQDIVALKKSGTLKTSSTTNGQSSSSTADETDQSSTDAAAGYSSSGRLDPFAANLGNKAFLVPTPIRILLSDWFMIEGFVMRQSVTFNKFTPNLVPTQAVVALQVQALYIGFAQKDTFLTTEIDIVDPNAGPSLSATDIALVNQTKEGIDNFFDKAGHLQGKNNSVDLMDSIFKNSQNKHQFNFFAHPSKEGRKFYHDATRENTNAGGFEMSVSGEMKIWWNKHVVNGGSRATSPKNASGSWSYADGPPPTSETGGADLSMWGTKENPFIVTGAEIPVYYYDFDTFFTKASTEEAVAILGGYKSESVGNYEQITSALRISSVNGANRLGTDWWWTFTRPIANLPIPFWEDKFDVELTLTVKAKRFEQLIEFPQKIVASYKGITANDDVLFNKMTVSPGYIPGKGPVGSISSKVDRYGDLIPTKRTETVR